MVRIVSLSVLLTLIVVLGLTFFKVLAPFILPLFLAAVFAILCQPIQAYFLERTKNRVRVASGLTTATIVSLFLIPLVVGTTLAALQLFVLASNLSDRNLGQTFRTTTEPVFQYAADFINSRTQPKQALPTSIEQDAETADETEGVDDDVALVGRDPLTIEADGAAGGDKKSSPSMVEDTTKTSKNEGDADTKSEDDKAAGSDANTDSNADSNTDIAVIKPEFSPIDARPPPESLTAESLRLKLQTWLRDSVTQIGGKSLGMAGGTFNVLSDSIMALGSAVLAFVIFAISLYYFLADGSELVRSTERLIPVHVEYQRQMLDEFAKVVRAVVMATFFAALAQAIATTAALWLFKFDHLFILFVVCLLMSMIPMMGTWLVWLPCAGYLLYTGHPVQAGMLSAYGAVVVGMLDNVVRTYILNNDTKLHPLLALISVLGGLQVMGLWGMFVGPIVASCLHALVNIFNHELSALSKEKFAGLDDDDVHEQPPPLDGDDAPSSPLSPSSAPPTVANSDSSGQNGESSSSKPPSSTKDA